MSATVTAVLARAATQIGVTESPRGSNRTPYTDWYGIGPAQWCDIFVSWVAAGAGAQDVIGRFAYTPSHANWFKRAGRWHTSHPRAGDVVFFDFGLGRISHVGFVERVLADGTLQTIEGNTDERGGRTGGQVMRKHRPLTHVVGYGRPGYAAPPKPPTPGHTKVQRLQRLLGVDPDNDWGSLTEQQAQRMRAAARQWTGGQPVRKLNVPAIQRTIGALPDGTWGPKSQHALQGWVGRVQQALGVTVDGTWGPQTERAFWALHHTATTH